MNCCQIQGIEELFTEESVAKELASYRRKGPGKTTRMMIEAIKAEGIEGYSLLDIGGGVGAIQHELIGAGVQQALDVDASRAYIHAAKAEAEQRGFADRVRFRHGDFVTLAGQIPPADIVTLDRVLCCYNDMKNLVNLSAERAQRLYALVYPRDTWLNRMVIKVMNFFFWLQKNPYRAFVHSKREVEALVRRKGLQRRFYRQTLFWQVTVYARLTSG